MTARVARWWPKWTTRRLMLAIFGLAFAIGLGLPAVHVWREPEYHFHFWIKRTTDPVILVDGTKVYRNLGQNPFDDDDTIASPFWPRYAKYLMGRPWRRQPVCKPAPGRVWEVCEFDHPELVTRQSSHQKGWTIPAPMMEEAYRRYPDFKAKDRQEAEEQERELAERKTNSLSASPPARQAH